MGVPGSANFLLAGAQGYQIERSLRFNSADSATLSKTPASATNRRSWTWSGWVKRSALGTQGLFSARQVKDDITLFGFAVNDRLWFLDRPSGVDNAQLITTNVFRDCSAWYHIVITIDTPNATASDRIRFYVNGVRTTQHDVATYPSQNYEIAYINNTQDHRIGTYQDTASNYFNGYLTEINFIDGQALTPSSFGETDTITGVWKPKRYSGTYGTNGFYLKFADNSGTTSTTLGKDSSGNGNNWTPNNFSVTAGAGNDSLIDTPTPYADGGNGRGNYCTGNPLYIPSSNSRMSLTNGNLEWGQAATNAVSSMAGTFAMRSGKWYWEVTVGGSLSVAAIGMQTDINTAWRGGGTVLYRSDGQKSIGGTASAYGASYTTNDVLGFAYDADAGTLTCYKNNTSQGTIYSSGTGNSWVPAIHDDNAGAGVTYYHQLNFGQRAFAYTPPSGFKALNTQNLPEPSIKKPSNYFDTLLYTGNGSASRTLSGLGFSPDLTWIKDRTNANWHRVSDTVRGGNKQLYTNVTDAEAANDINGYLSAFTSDGFTVAAGSTSADGVNKNGNAYVAWCWDESATPGFDIVTYTGDGVSGRTVSHSLGVAPKMMIVKNRSVGSGGDANWQVYHESIGNTHYLILNLTDNASSTGGIGRWNNTSPTSSVFTLGNTGSVNNSGQNYVAYLWSEVAGFSKFGSYTGNGSSDGPFVFCGFRPRWIMFKNSTTGGNSWHLYDTLRSGSGGNNTLDYLLMPNNSNAEEQNLGSTPYVDALSNGFKIRRTGGGANTNGDTYIFAAFAESPFKYSLAR